MRPNNKAITKRKNPATHTNHKIKIIAYALLAPIITNKLEEVKKAEFLLPNKNIRIRNPKK